VDDGLTHRTDYQVTCTYGDGAATPFFIHRLRILLFFFLQIPAITAKLLAERAINYQWPFPSSRHGSLLQEKLLKTLRCV